MMLRGGRHFVQISCFSSGECMTFTDLELPPTNILQMRDICPWFCELPGTFLPSLGWNFFCDLAVIVQNQDVSCYWQLVKLL